GRRPLCGVGVGGGRGAADGGAGAGGLAGSAAWQSGGVRTRWGGAAAGTDRGRPALSAPLLELPAAAAGGAANPCRGDRCGTGSGAGAARPGVRTARGGDRLAAAGGGAGAA